MHITAEHIRVLTKPGHTERVRFAFSLQGLAYDIVHILPAQEWDSQRGMQLAHALRLVTWCGWYDPITKNLSHGTTQRIFHLLGTLGGFSLRKFNGRDFIRYLQVLTDDQQYRVCNLLLPACFYQRGTISRTEFLEILMKEHDFSVVPKDVYQSLDASLKSLEDALLKKDPMMKRHLQESHSLLINYPETVALLRPPEVKLLINAAEEHVKTEVVSATAAKRGSSGGSKKQIGLDMI